MKKQIKLTIFALTMLAAGAVNAQITDPTDDKLQNNGDATKVVRLIDNKGTIKYLQSKNGITQITSTDGGHQTVTTFQLGGTLDDDTTITLNDGTTDHSFTIDGINFNLANTAAITPGATVDDAAATTTGGDGYMLLVRDEDSGQVKKLLASELITSGQTYFTAATDGQTDYDLSGASSATPITIDLPNFSKVWVYRNGAKLISGLDYELSGTSNTTVVLKPGGTAPNDWAVYAGDVIEVQFVK